MDSRSCFKVSPWFYELETMINNAFIASAMFYLFAKRNLIFVIASLLLGGYLNSINAADSKNNEHMKPIKKMISEIDSNLPGNPEGVVRMVFDEIANYIEDSLKLIVEKIKNDQDSREALTILKGRLNVLQAFMNVVDVIDFDQMQFLAQTLTIENNNAFEEVANYLKKIPDSDDEEFMLINNLITIVENKQKAIETFDRSKGKLTATLFNGGQFSGFTWQGNVSNFKALTGKGLPEGFVIPEGEEITLSFSEDFKEFLIHKLLISKTEIEPAMPIRAKIINKKLVVKNRKIYKGHIHLIKVIIGFDGKKFKPLPGSKIKMTSLSGKTTILKY